MYLLFEKLSCYEKADNLLLLTKFSKNINITIMNVIKLVEIELIYIIYRQTDTELLHCHIIELNLQNILEVSNIVCYKNNAILNADGFACILKVFYIMKVN